LAGPLGGRVVETVGLGQSVKIYKINLLTFSMTLNIAI